MPPRSDADVSNETTNSNSAVHPNSLTMSNSNQTSVSHPSTVLHQAHQPHNFVPGAQPPNPYQTDLYNKPPMPYVHQPWQGNAFRPQITPPGSNPTTPNPYANPAAFYHQNRLPNPPPGLPANYNQTPQTYMNYAGVPPGAVQSSQYNSANMMPPPNNPNYPKMSTPQMYPPRPPPSQSILPPGQHSYPNHPQHSLPAGHHQYPQNYKMYFNGFLPYPQQIAGYAPGHPDYPTIENHLPSSALPPNAQIPPAQQSAFKPTGDFNGNHQQDMSNNFNANNSASSTSNQEQMNAIQNDNNVPLNSSLNKNSQQSPVSNAIIDEASQASTSSSHNEERTETPKSSKQHSHPTTPNPLGSPSNVSMSSLQDEYDNSSNPSWPRTPASPVVNSDHSKKKGESLQKLFEMSDEPERRIFLDKLICFNDKNGVKLNSCPHISKTLIDLFKLYSLVKDRGGFVEVTKKKLWKEMANMIKMPIASTTSYMLRKAYIKHLLPFECKFDRGGADMEKVLIQVESNSKKKAGKNSSASPQPADTNSQSSYPQASTPQSLNTSNNQPSSKTQSPNLQPPANFQNGPNAQQQGGLGPNLQMPPYHIQQQLQQQQLQQQHLQQQQQLQHQQLQQQQNHQIKLNEENYQRKMANQMASSQKAPPVDYYPNYDAYNRTGKNIPVPFPNQSRTNLQQPGMPGQNYSAHLPQQTDYQSNYQQQSPMGTNYLPNQMQMKPPMMMNNSPYSKRHADFVKAEQSFPSNYPPANLPPNYQPNFAINQHPLNSQYSTPQPTQPAQLKENYSNANEFLSNSFLNNYNKQPHVSPLISHHRPHANFDQKQSFPSSAGSSLYQSSAIVPTTTVVHPPEQQSLLPVNQMRVIRFPSESIEAIKPVFVKRKRISAKDLSQIDPLKLMMSLKSGLLAETTWAIDVLSILLHDDSTYSYFGLQNLPGLLELLLEHYKLYLGEIFPDLFKDIVIANQENGSTEELSFEENFVKQVLEANDKFKTKYNLQIESLENDVDEDSEDDEMDSTSEGKKKSKFKRIKLSKLDTLSIHTDHKQTVLTKCENYTLKNRKGLPVYFVDDDENLFINDMFKRWDKSSEILHKTDADHWKKTFLNSSDFIQRTFQPSDNDLLFAENSKDQQNGDVDQAEKNGDSNDVSDDEVEISSENVYPRFREKLKSKKFLENHENEAYQRDSPPLCSLTDYRESIAQKCICFSTLIRNLSFVQGNEIVLAKNRALLLMLGRLLLLHHKHPEKRSTNKTSLNDILFNENGDLDKLEDKLKENRYLDDDHQLSATQDEWWWDTLVYLRENALVTISNISGALNLSKFNEDISFPIFSGLLHWTVCPSSSALDNFKTSSITSISPSRLSLECLVKLSVLSDNVDLCLATQPYNRDTVIFETLTNHLRRNEDQTLREFALVLLHNLAISDVNIARAIALSTDAIQQLIVYIELANENALNIVSTQGKQSFKENPEAIGTTLDMVKRAALCLRCLARIPENRPLFFSFQQRLVQLVMSNVFDHKITSVIADVMYELSIEDNFNNLNTLSSTQNNDSNEEPTISHHPVTAK